MRSQFDHLIRDTSREGMDGCMEWIMERERKRVSSLKKCASSSGQVLPGSMGRACACGVLRGYKRGSGLVDGGNASVELQTAIL